MRRALSWRSITAVLAFALLWELAGRLGWLNPVLLSYPTAIASEGVRLFRHGHLATDTLFTVRVFAESFAVAVGGGVTIGLVTGYSALADEVLSPFIAVANSLPKIVLMPLIVLWLGIGAAANVFLGALMAGFPILMSVRSGVKSVDPGLIQLGRVYGASRALVLRRIVVPAIMPFLLSGMRVAVSYGMVGVLIAEFFGSSRGLGYRMVLYAANFEVAGFFVCAVTVAVAAILFTAIVHQLERRAERWRPPVFARPGM